MKQTSEVARSFDEFHAEVLSKNQMTPDAVALNDYENHLVFVYGSLKQGYQRDILPTNKMLGKYRTVHSCYQLFQTSAGFPVALHRDEMKVQDKPAGYILGELYLLEQAYIPLLDRIESNGRLYQRHQTLVQSLLFSEKQYAWMYCGMPYVFDEKELSDTYVSKMHCKETDKYYFEYNAPRRIAAHAG